MSDHTPGFVCIQGWLYSDVGGMVFPTNKRCQCQIGESPVAETKLCKDCKHFRLPGKWDGVEGWCTGPHVAPSIVTGKRLMSLPGARYSGGDGLVSVREAKPCREEGNHWEPLK